MVNNTPSILIRQWVDLIVPAPSVKSRNFFVRPCIDARYISLRRHGHDRPIVIRLYIGVYANKVLKRMSENSSHTTKYSSVRIFERSYDKFIVSMSIVSMSIVSMSIVSMSIVGEPLSHGNSIFHMALM